MLPIDDRQAWCPGLAVVCTIQRCTSASPPGVVRLGAVIQLLRLCRCAAASCAPWSVTVVAGRLCTVMTIDFSGYVGL